VWKITGTETVLREIYRPILEEVFAADAYHRLSARTKVELLITTINSAELIKTRVKILSSR